MTNYNLVSQGPVDLYRVTSLFDIRKIARDPLQGVVDGSNKTFFASMPPIMSQGSVGVAVGSTVQASSAFVVQYDTGEIDMVSAPAQQVYAWYTTCSMPPDRQMRALFRGFDEMELRWPRGYRLSSSLSAYTEALETDAAVYVVSASDLTDPVSPSDGATFSQKRSQIGFFMECCRFAYFLNKFGEEAEKGLSYRENSGMSVNTSGRAGALDKLVARLETRLCDALRRAQDAWDSSSIGDAVLNPQSLYYRIDLEWQQDSKDQDIRNISL